MRFPNAYQGVKKIFTAEIVSLIVYILYLVFLGKAKKMLAEN